MKVLVLSTVLIGTLVNASVFQLTEFVKKLPEISYIKNRTPVELKCAAKFASEISFKCNGKSVADHKIKNSFDEEPRVLTATLLIQRKQVEEYFGMEDYWCHCSARSESTKEWEKTKKSFIQVAYLEQKFQKPLPQSGGVKYGEKFVLDCRPPKGIPAPDVSWIKDGKILNIDKIDYELTEKGDLIVNQVDQTANGNYTCRASNIAGVRETPIAKVYVWVNGEWSNWSEYSECKPETGDCGIGTRDKYRSCNSPVPVNGKACRGQKYREDRCMVKCPDIQIPIQIRPMPIEIHFADDSYLSDSENNDSQLILIGSLVGGAGFALVIFISIFAYFRSKRNIDYFKKAELKKAPFNANNDFDLIRAPSQVDARTPSHPEYSTICNRKDNLEKLEHLLYRPESAYPKPNGYGYPLNHTMYSECNQEEYATRSSSGVSTDRNQDVEQNPLLPHNQQILPSLNGAQIQYHQAYPTYSYPYQPR